MKGPFTVIATLFTCQLRLPSKPHSPETHPTCQCLWSTSVCGQLVSVVKGRPTARSKSFQWDGTGVGICAQLPYAMRR